MDTQDKEEWSLEYNRPLSTEEEADLIKARSLTPQQLDVMPEQELIGLLSSTYWSCERQWQFWRRVHPNDGRSGSEYAGSEQENKIGLDWRTHTTLHTEWKKRHPNATEGVKYHKDGKKFWFEMILK